MSETEALAREARAAWSEYAAVRNRINAGELRWAELARFFTEDAAFIDPAWGRVDGIDRVIAFLDESMSGLDAWTFDEVWTMVEGRRVVSMFNQVMGRLEDGHAAGQPGISVLYYAGDGKFCYEMDLMNMAHVMEMIGRVDWKPSGTMNMPPQDPNRDWRLPAAWRHLADDGVLEPEG
jgi:hypothetical protein